MTAILIVSIYNSDILFGKSSFLYYNFLHHPLDCFFIIYLDLYLFFARVSASQFVFLDMQPDNIEFLLFQFFNILLIVQPKSFL